MSTPEITAAKANYDAAMAAQQAAKAIVDGLKTNHAATIKTYQDAKAAFDSLKPTTALAKARLQRAEADVNIARAEWQALAPKEAAAENAAKKGTGNAALLVAVRAFLTTKHDGASNQEIFDALLAGGVEMGGAKARANLNSYLSRWASAGSLVSKGSGKWGVAAPAATPSFLTAPAYVTEEEEQAEWEKDVAERNARLAASGEPVTTPGDVDALAEDFPGVEALAEAGITTKAALVGATKESLVAIPGIGAKTADKILAAV